MEVSKYHDLIFFILIAGLIIATNLYLRADKQRAKLAKELVEKNLHIKNLEVLKDRLSDDLSESLSKIKKLELDQRLNFDKSPPPVILTQNLPVFRIQQKEFDHRNQKDFAKKWKFQVIEESLKYVREELDRQIIVTPYSGHEIRVDFDFTFQFIRNNNV